MHAIEVPAALWGLMGFAGVIYSMIVARRMNTRTAYRPGFEDWLFHAVLPFSAYLLLAGLTFAVQAHMREVLFGVGAVTLLLLFSSIHNAWDSLPSIFLCIFGTIPTRSRHPSTTEPETVTGARDMGSAFVKARLLARHLQHRRDLRPTGASPHDKAKIKHDGQVTFLDLRKHR
jgi:hypothetical protein